MAPRTKTGLTILSVIALAVASAFAGGTYGFLQGYVYGLGDTGARAATLTTSLRTLRSGDVTKGITLLESSLDVLIVEHWATSRGDLSVFAWFVRASGKEETERTLFGHVARYRKEYPSSTVVPEVGDIIASHLKGFLVE